jgi:hypothetical protein
LDGIVEYRIIPESAIIASKEVFDFFISCAMVRFVLVLTLYFSNAKTHGKPMDYSLSRGEFAFPAEYVLGEALLVDRDATQSMSHWHPTMEINRHYCRPTMPDRSH